MTDPTLNENIPSYKKTMLQVAAYKRIRAAINVVLGHFDLNATQWMIMGMLYENATGLKITEIARSLEVEVPLITRLARSLSKGGLVQRELNMQDRRVKPLALTAYGKQLVAKVEQQMGKQMQAFENNIDDERAVSYFETLEALTKSAKPKIY